MDVANCALRTSPKFTTGEKLKKKATRGICKRILDIEFERDRSIGLDAAFGDSHRQIHIQFSKTLFLELRE